MWPVKLHDRAAADVTWEETLGAAPADEVDDSSTGALKPVLARHWHRAD